MTLERAVPTLRSIAAIAAAVRALPARPPRTVIGIAGAPGSGKSTIATAVVRALGPAAIVLPMDGFHLTPERLVELGRRDRMGAPDTFDVDGFLRVLSALRRAPGAPGTAGAAGAPDFLENSGSDVYAPGFNRVIERPVADAIRVTPEFSIVVVEGNYLLHDRDGWEQVAPLLDACYFVSVDSRVRLQRLIDRHVAFGKPPVEAVAWAEGPDEANARLIEAGARRADALIALD